MPFSLNESLDTGAAARSFAEQRYVQIPNVLSAADAERIFEALEQRTPWNLVFNDRGKHVDLSAEQAGALPQSNMQQLRQAIYTQAREHFQYFYHNYPIHDAHEAGLNKDHVLHRFYDWLNTEEFLDFARAVTGYSDISNLDAQATRYMPGHFLSTHDDIAEGKNRRAAYIFNFTPRWNPDWGGYLQLLSEDHQVRAGLKPSFNCLNLIAIPQAHNVSLVTPFAAAPRYAVTGWLRYA